MATTISRRKTKDSATVGRKRVEPDQTQWNGRVGARLTELRERQGIEVSTLLESLRTREHIVKKSTWYAYESGRLSLPTALIPALAEIFGCSVRSVLPPQ